jgi:U3 small nucleolar RNA-associated protein 3
MAGKKRKSGKGKVADGPREFNEKDGKLNISTYEDVADSEDEFHIQRDKIALDEGPDVKRQRKMAEEDKFLEQSDEEILGYDESEEEEDDDEDDEEEYEQAAPKGKKRKASSDSEEEGAGDSEEEVEGWGTSKKDYYNADEIQTEQDALEEEQEAKRLQKKKLEKMSEADFGFDESEWLNEAKEDEENDVVTEVLKDVEVTEDMGPEERLRLLQSRYPEFEFLANEFVALHPQLEEVNDEVAATGSKVATIKSRALAAYLGALTMYFAIFTSPAQSGEASVQAFDPNELRDHAVMDSLLQCREMWNKAKTLQPDDMPFEGMDEDVSEDEATPVSDDEEMQTIKPAKKTAKAKKLEAAATATAKARQARIAAAEAELADLDDLVAKPRKSATKVRAIVQDDDSDFGEEETLDARTAAEKEKRKKSLRFYTSQIAQKANKRADAGRDAGGDADLPYRERLRDRQARLNAEAEKRGKLLDKYGRGTALGGDSDEEDEQAKAKEVREEEDEYYDMVAQTSKAKKQSREEKIAALKAGREAARLERVEEEGDVDGKRAIGYTIQKNKGLAPKRKKEVRNPRVKKRMKFEEKKKKLSSMRAVYKGGEERGGYGGEKTGIKTGLVKSIKL